VQLRVGFRAWALPLLTKFSVRRARGRFYLGMEFNRIESS
jgi:hypothetical protein